jgi:hypothetical protein
LVPKLPLNIGVSQPFSSKDVSKPLASSHAPSLRLAIADVANEGQQLFRALSLVHGADTARVMWTKGLSLAALFDALLRSPLKNSEAVKLITRALQSGDFIITPDFGAASHLKYVYDPPRSLHVVDVAVMTVDHGTLASTDIRLRLAS